MVFAKRLIFLSVADGLFHILLKIEPLICDIHVGCIVFEGP